jgi:hypothetical protein
VTWLATLVVVLGLSPLLADCRGEEVPAGGEIDLQTGTYDGVGIGNTPVEMQAAFGAPPHSDEQGAQPLGARRFRGPTGFRSWPDPNPGRDFVPPPVYRYPHVAFFDDGTGRISVVAVIAPGAVTPEGVAIGDPLASVEGVYPVRCGEEFGAGEPPYPACVGQLEADRWVWFGGDPIENITVGRFRMRTG